MVAEAIYDGVWMSGAPPEEFVEFELCYAMHLSWQDLQDMPVYVRRVWWDLLCARRNAEGRRRK